MAQIEIMLVANEIDAFLSKKIKMKVLNTK